MCTALGPCPRIAGVNCAGVAQLDTGCLGVSCLWWRRRCGEAAGRLPGGGQQQRFLSAAAAWAAREAAQRREAHARAAAAAAELLHAHNALADALGREQSLRAECEVSPASAFHGDVSLLQRAFGHPL